MPKQPPSQRLRLAAFCLATAFSFVMPAFAAADTRSPDGTETPDFDAIIREIELIANSTANSHAYFDEDMRPMRIEVSVSLDDAAMYFDMDKRFGEEAGFMEMNDLQGDVERATEKLRDEFPGVKQAIWRFGGHNTPWWLDRGRRTTPSRASRSIRVRSWS